MEKLTGLQALYLNDNQISDISFLEKLTGLQNLHLSANQISDISFLEKLTGLQNLHFSANQISDYSFLEKLTGLRSLDLSANQISDISFLEKLTGLQALYLSANQISDYSFLEKLTGLQTLNLSDNQISDYSFLEKLTGLQTLNLSANQISDYSFLEKLTGLQNLHLSDNQISDISFLEKLTGLQTLNLSYNQISDISFLEKLTGLQTLDLSYNQISDISFLEKLTGLQTLYLNDNQISDISFLEKLTGLQTLDLTANQISDISFLEKLTGLQTLYLNNNQIKYISIAFLRKFCNLSWLSLLGNPLIEIPISIVNKHDCLEDLKNYLEDTEDWKVLKNNEIKLIFLGNGGVGKTQIAKRLKEQNDFIFNTQHHSTHGITLARHNIPCRLFPDRGLQINIWDFAGQDLYHATHRLFMQTQAVFVLVWDIATENEPYHLHDGNKFKNRNLSYWLEYIHCFGKKSPIIVLQNKVDEGEDKWSGLPTPAQNEFRKKYNVHCFLQISAKTGNGFYALEKSILKLMNSDKQLKEDLLKELPTPWVDVKSQLQKAIDAGEKATDKERFQKLCVNHDIEKSHETILRFLHDTGLLFFKEGYFNDKIILDQNWAIDAVYALLNRKSRYFEFIESKQGHIEYDDLVEIWKDNTDRERMLFIDFMLSCELCFEIGKDSNYKPLQERRFVIPQLLPETEPASIALYEEKRKINIEKVRSYRFLPEVFIHRFIVRAESFARIDDIWQYGLMLEYSNSFAIVKANFNNDQIVIRHTANAQQLVQAIQHEMDDIEGIGRIKPQKHLGSEMDGIEIGELYLKGFKKLQSIGSKENIYPGKNRNSNFNKNKMDARKHIDKQFHFIKEYYQQYGITHDPVQRAAIENKIKKCVEAINFYKRQQNDLEYNFTNDQEAILMSIRDLVESTKRKTDMVDQKLDEVISLQDKVLARMELIDQSIIKSHIKDYEPSVLETILTKLEDLENGRFNEQAMQSTINSVLKDLSKTSINNKNEIMDKLNSPSLSPKSKLRITIPLIPYFMQFSTEIPIGWPRKK